jgi:glycosyltransferase involved in cell wall biosynthesis
MIVRDESSIIHRALESMKHVIDSFYIHDTGSTDGTQEIIRSYGRTHGIHGYVEDRVWRNFGANKTDLIQSAQTHSDEKISKAKYYVWLDADEVWITDRANPLSYPSRTDANALFDKLESLPNADIFMILTLFGGLEYRRWNMCRNNQVYEWKQPVHEYFVGHERNTTEFISNIYLLARKEGNSAKNPDRYKRDVEMFQEFLKANPKEPRATFYLAQSLEGLDEDLANQTYKDRILLDGYYEEKYIACLRLGRRLKDEAERIKYLMQGTFINPHRLECYYELMMIQYNKVDHKKAVAYGLMAPESRTANSGFLFAEPVIYNYNFDLHFGVSCYYAEMYTQGMKATQRALDYPQLPEHTKKTLNANIGFFKTKLDVFVPRNVSCDAIGSEVPSVIVVDNFYKNPDEVRALALTMPFEIKGNYPSLRTKPHVYPGTKERFEQIVNRKITYWPTGDTSYNGSFQYCTEKHSSWIHRDSLSYSCVIFLTKNPPPDSGTKLMIHKETNLRYTHGDKALEETLNKDSRNDSAWITIDRVGNLYNRAILFKGLQNHISDRYFGDCLENGRLFQTFFFSID